MNTNPTIRFFCTAKCTRWIGFSLAAVFAIGASAEAQQFQLEEYLKRKDVNRNGLVEPSEMSDNGRGFLKKMGFDSNKPISIKKIVGKANADRKKAAANATKSSGRTRKVPGFGVDKTTESASVSRFSGSASARASSTKSDKTAKYSDGVIKQVKDTLARYDRNRNGSLDREELKNARWGSPPPEQSDTNRDGRLTKDELANRYASREQYYRNSRSSSSDRSREQARREAEVRARGEYDRSRYRSSSSSSYSSPSRTTYAPSSTSTRSSSSGSSSTTSSSSQEKYEKYADSLVNQYDENKDGKLSSDETKKMRRPPAGADADKDGFITKSELVNSLSGTTKATASEKPSGNDNNSSRYSRDRGSSGDSRPSSSRPGSTYSFEKLDANTDRQVQMHEYASKWDDKTVEEFYAKDKNGDGVITLREWTGKN